MNWFSDWDLGAKKLFTLILGVAISLTVTQGLSAQGTKADYERLASIRRNTGNKVFRVSLNPNWVHGEKAMWYRIQTGPKQYEFVVVNLQSKTRELAFNPSEFAKNFEELSGKKLDPMNLPFIRIALDKRLENVFVKVDGKAYKINRKSNLCSEVSVSDIPSQDPISGGISPSGPSEVSVNVTFKNSRKRPVRLFWIDTEGRSRSYGEVMAGKSIQQHTYLGHVWIVTDAKLTPLVVVDVESDKQEVVIDENSTVDTTFPRNLARGNQRQMFARSNAVSPDRKWRVIVKDHNVQLKDQASEETVQLTTDGAPKDFYSDNVYWSPDSKRFVVLRETPAQEHKVYMVESSPRDQVQPKLHSMNYLKPGDKIRQQWPALFDVDAKKQIDVSNQLFKNPWRLRDFRWSKDSKQFFFRYNQRGHQVLRIVGINALNGVAKAIVDETSKTFIDYSRKLMVRYLPNSNEIVWSSERDGWNHLYLYDNMTGELKNQITKGNWLVRSIDRIDEENRVIWFQAGGIIPNQDPYYLHHCRINFDGSGLVVMTRGDGTHTIRYSPSGKFILDKYSQVDRPPVHEIRETKTGKLVVKLEAGDDSLLRKTGWKAPERFVAMARDNRTPIFGVIYRPTHFDPKKQYPVIEYIYAGPHGSFVPKSFATIQSSQALTELGFIVVQIDGMGTSNRSKAFHDVCWKNLGDSGFPDRIRWIKAAAKKYPYMDTTRVGIYGGSAGGQSSTRALLAFGDFYDVAVSDCGCHDNRMDKIWWNEQWMGWPIGPHYEEQSNVTNAHRLQGKLLLIVGELDRNVDPASTMQVVNALIKADKDFDFLLVPGGGHGIGSRPYGRRRTYDFFVRHLHGVEPRSD